MQLALPIVIDGERRIDEFIEVEPVGSSRYRVTRPPSMVEGLAANDVFELDEKELAGFRVVTRSGLVTIWLFFASEQQREAHADNPLLHEAFRKVGGRLESCEKESAVFSVPVTAGFLAIESLCDTLTEVIPGSGWQYGNVHGFDENPLNWWSSA